MKIHSSSLNISPVGFNQKSGKNNAQNTGQSVEKDAQSKRIDPASSPEHIKNALDSVGLGINLTSQDNVPTNSRTLKALSAYDLQFKAPQQEQRAQLITGIDAYA